MRFWSSRALVNDIVIIGISQKDIVGYWILSGIFYWLLFGLVPPAGDAGSFPGQLKIGFSVISQLISVLGIIACYRYNGGVNGEHLLDRFTALFLVASIRGLVFPLAPIMLTFSVIYVFIFNTGEIGVFPKYLGAYLSIAYYKLFVYFAVARNLRLINVRSLA